MTAAVAAPTEADRLNDDLAAASPALAALLSPLGRRAAFPRGIPFQSAEARGKRFNGTIGQITDGRGGALAPPSLAAPLAGLAAADRDRATLYSPIDGLPELRRRWRERQRRDAPEGVESTLPLVTAGLTHGLSLVADLFAGEGRAVAVPEPFWGNYRGVFATRTGARLIGAPAYRDRRPDAAAAVRAVAGLPAGEPAIAILNFPSNPGGWSPGAAEREELVRALVEEAGRRPLLAVCDDAYAGLVYADGVPGASLFWQLAGRHPNLVPVKVDGATKELAFFGGRVGFLTFALPPESAAARALESKVKGLVRSTISSPVAASQVVALAALESPSIEDEIESLRHLLAARWRAIVAALADCDPELLVALPSNSGSFVLVELTAPGVDPEALRRHLLDRHDTGVVAIAPR
ncbi:MAG TPA: aminotransferase class I/II-fold pyridoxal phosphate-dependent enzyme, partial [Thermoanaerobaculia bacterium]